MFIIPIFQCVPNEADQLKTKLDAHFPFSVILFMPPSYSGSLFLFTFSQSLLFPQV